MALATSLETVENAAISNGRTTGRKRITRHGHQPSRGNGLTCAFGPQGQCQERLSRYAVSPTVALANGQNGPGTGIE